MANKLHGGTQFGSDMSVCAPARIQSIDRRMPWLSGWFGVRDLYNSMQTINVLRTMLWRSWFAFALPTLLMLPTSPPPPLPPPFQSLPMILIFPTFLRLWFLWIHEFHSSRQCWLVVLAPKRTLTHTHTHSHRSWSNVWEAKSVSINVAAASSDLIDRRWFMLVPFVFGSAIFFSLLPSILLFSNNNNYHFYDRFIN